MQCAWVQDSAELRPSAKSACGAEKHSLAAVCDRQRLLSRLLAGGALHGHIARISLSGERRGAAAGSLAEAYQSKSVWEEQDVTAKEVWDVARESGRIVPQSELVTS